MDELNNYIRKARNRGFSDKEIMKQLTINGWDENAVLQALGLKIPNGSMTSKIDKKSKYTPSRGVKVIYKIIRYVSLFIFANTTFQIFFALSINTYLSDLSGIGTWLYLLMVPFLLTNPLTLIIQNVPASLLGIALFAVYIVLSALTLRSLLNEHKGLSLNPFTFLKNKSLEEISMYILVAFQILPFLPLLSIAIIK